MSNVFDYVLSENVCPFCGSLESGMCIMDAVEFRCGTSLSTMRINSVYNQSEECKSRVEKKVKE